MTDMANQTAPRPPRHFGSAYTAPSAPRITYGCTLAWHYAVDHFVGDDRWNMTRHGITITRINDISHDLAEVERTLRSEFAILTGLPLANVHIVGLTTD